MTWYMVREMRAAGMMIGGHTVSHPILAQVSAEEQWAEISQCGRRLQDELGQPMRYFSYPVGDGPGYFDDTSRNCLRKCGVDYAFSHYGGISGFDDWDDLDIRRIPVEREMSFDYFRTMATLPRLYG
jgi:peptidoglycan/xylan/chitin deacetylase (PgdA/CDA1 family)